MLVSCPDQLALIHLIGFNEPHRIHLPLRPDWSYVQRTVGNWKELRCSLESKHSICEYLALAKLHSYFIRTSSLIESTRRSSRGFEVELIMLYSKTSGKRVKSSLDELERVQRQVKPLRASSFYKKEERMRWEWDGQEKNCIRIFALYPGGVNWPIAPPVHVISRAVPFSLLFSLFFFFWAPLFIFALIYMFMVSTFVVQKTPLTFILANECWIWMGVFFCDEETISGEICNASGMDSIIRKNRAARHIWIIFWFEEVPFFYNYNTKTNVTLFLTS